MEPTIPIVQLRAMNIIYETTKERGATILIPSAMVDAMNVAAALQWRGFVKRWVRTSPALNTYDQRMFKVALTARGQAIHQDLDAVVSALIKEWLTVLFQPYLDTLSELRN